MLGKNNTRDVSALFAEDERRGLNFSLLEHGWLLDYSRLPLTADGYRGLQALAAASGLDSAVRRLFGGEIVNPSEHRPALHMALRAEDPSAFPGADPDRVLAIDRSRFLDLAEDFHSGRSGLSDLVHIGIGGSDLGPRLVADALDVDDGAARVHWLSTVDARRMGRLLRDLDPDTTGVVIASKSFSTEETLLQAQALKAWLGDRFTAQAWAATAKPESAKAFGVSGDHILGFPEWTGGRFSLWSSVGVSAAARLGRDCYTDLLRGAAEADACFAGDARDRSLALHVAVLMHFLRRDLDAPSLGVVAYDPRLALLGDFLQQLVMESLGKGVDLDDAILTQSTSPLIFGGRGTDLQHSIFQALHQAPDSHPLILVGALEPGHDRPDWHRVQLAHMLAQATAMARGRHDDQASRLLPGNRPVMMLMAERLNARSLGFLLASFEHAVFALSVLWKINPFDQWGVEEGKRLAADFKTALQEHEPLDFETWLELSDRGMRS
ncbi:MAG: glucose-6-phosphate isomerase [Wenzhouxiangella sp.]|nr:MAG: glucose-6-phosphate isomerase [Wenzhouxiangella sp.]